MAGGGSFEEREKQEKKINSKEKKIWEREKKKEVKP